MKDRAAQIIEEAEKLPKHKRGWYVKCAVDELPVPDRWVVKAYMLNIRKERSRAWR